MKIATPVVLALGASILLAQPSHAQGEIPVVIPRARAFPTDAEQRATNRKYLAVVREEVRRSKRAGKPHEVIIHARTSWGYGCSCIPFMFDPIDDSGEPGFWPRYGAGVQRMPFGFHGPFRLTGHFEPNFKTGYQVWGPDAPRANDEDPSAIKAPVFAVSAWCWDLTNRQVPEVGSWQIDDVEEMINRGNVCASAAQMKLLRRELKRAKSESRKTPR